ncbi:sensor histidine kinase [Massiliimalia massiliensis]|uniref:sensor histidine kinase n=1 Tax=Massiliimalia massiliensis TaxID=1852384 RepID=UPI00098559EE|nr:ATP-binding protein [Massiliimalia massiliensis]
MTKRIFRSIITVAALVLVSCLIFIMGVLYEYFSGQFQKELQQAADYIGTAVEQEGFGYLDQIHSDETRVTLIDADGTVLFDNTADITSMENHLDREEVQEALNKGTGESYRYSDTLSEKTFYYAEQLENGMVLRVSGTQYSVLTLIYGILQPLAIVLIILIVLSAVFANRAAKKIVQPINALDLENPPDDAYDELAPLLMKIRRQKRMIKSQLREAKRKQQEFSMITENMEEGFLVINSKTDLLSYNSSALRILGAKTEEAKESVLALNRSAPFRQAVEQVLEGVHQETLLDIQGGTYQLIANPVSQDDEVTGAVLILMDITERTQLERMRREFTANVSHELKTPLTSISGFAEIIQDGLVKQEDIPAFAGKIFTESQRLIRLVEDIIKLSQLDEGSVPYQKDLLDLYQIAIQVAAQLQPPAQESGITVAVEGEHAIISGVRPILEEVIFNLCDNGIKYNRPGGRVTIQISDESDRVSLTVSDTGVGIPLSDQERVFERFYRVDKSHSKEIGGTGLGLSIVKHGAAFLGAELSLKSALNQGTAITLTWEK